VRNSVHAYCVLATSTMSAPSPRTFAGIAPAGVGAFIVGQLVGMLAAVLISRWLWASK
jgi:hypothetical protein